FEKRPAKNTGTVQRLGRGDRVTLDTPVANLRDVDRRKLRAGSAPRPLRHGRRRCSVNDAVSPKDWLGRTRRDEDEVTLGAVQRLAATLDQDPKAFRRGSEMPESWYAILFGRVAREGPLQADGPLLTGDSLPPLHGTRRMFAGRRTKFIKPLKIGEVVSRVSTVTRAEPKTGRTGPFTLVTVRHEISGPAGL